MATILTPGSPHLANFNKPRYSPHKFVVPARPRFIKDFYESKHNNILMGLAIWNPNRYRYDLIHSFNEIPITNKPWIVTIESTFPRTFGKYGKYLKKLLRGLTLRQNCIKLIFLSKYGVKKTAGNNRGWSKLSEMMKKVEVIPPTIPLKTKQPKQYDRNKDKLRIIFCGNDFARKGGIVALRFAKLAHEANVPLQIDLISKMRFDSYTDFMDKSRYETDLKLLDLPNVTLHGKLPNATVIELLAASDFQLLPTLHDTYGYSIIEGFSVGTPAIATSTCAIPEFVRHQENGFLLQVDVNEDNDIQWIKPSSFVSYRSTDEYWEQLGRTYDDFARKTFNILQSFLTNPSDYERLSYNAIEQVIKFHNAETTSERLNNFYDEILSNR